MMKQYNRVCARIDLDAIEYNMEMMHKNTREGVSMISVIKTDGYGHGAVQIARMLEPKDYIWGYAVALSLIHIWSGRDFSEYRRGGDLGRQGTHRLPDPQLRGEPEAAAERAAGAVRKSGWRNHQDHQRVSGMAV